MALILTSDRGGVTIILMNKKRNWDPRTYETILEYNGMSIGYGNFKGKPELGISYKKGFIGNTPLVIQPPINEIILDGIEECDKEEGIHGKASDIQAIKRFLGITK